MERYGEGAEHWAEGQGAASTVARVVRYWSADGGRANCASPKARVWRYRRMRWVGSPCNLAGCVKSEGSLGTNGYHSTVWCLCVTSVAVVVSLACMTALTPYKRNACLKP